MVSPQTDDGAPSQDNSAYTRLKRGVEASCDNGEMLTKWVAIIEVMDADGDRGTWMPVNEDATLWDTLGLLRYAVKRIETRIEMMEAHQMNMRNQVPDEDDD